MKLGDLTLIIWALALITGASAASAQEEKTPSAGAARCQELNQSRFEFNTVPDAPTVLNSVAVTRMERTGTEVCVIEGFVSPNVGIKLALPLEGWNGKYMQGGCGGACGMTRLIWCDMAIKKGYACASTDMGHSGNGLAWAWAYNDLQRMADFGYRSTHVTALAAKAIVERFYGLKPKYAYFYGCSTGGRQGYVEAQRFPDDFDGIVAGAPPLDETATALQLAWSTLATRDAQGRYVIDAADIQFLHSKVNEACDLNDGLKDGLIGDPRSCRFDLSRLSCSAGSMSGECLSPAKIAAVRKLYSGPIDSTGKAIGRLGGVMLGSELAWINDYVPGPKGAPQYDAFIRQFFQYVSFNPAAGPSWDFKDLDFERDAKRLGMNEMLFTANNPDLRNFKARGGKLISFQGWGDTSVVPMQVIDFYELATRTMGGPGATRDFYRLFMVPGMRHCSSDSVGGDTVDWLSMIEAWVEQGKAPDVAIGHSRTAASVADGPPIFPLEPATIRLTRPHFPYPAVTRYRGKGDPNDPTSYVAEERR